MASRRDNSYSLRQFNPDYFLMERRLQSVLYLTFGIESEHMIIRLGQGRFLDANLLIIATFYIGIALAFAISFTIGAGTPLKMALEFAIPFSILFATFLALPCITLYTRKGNMLFVRHLLQSFQSPIDQCQWTWVYGSVKPMLNSMMRFTSAILCLQNSQTGQTYPFSRASEEPARRALINFFHTEFGVKLPTEDMFLSNEKKIKSIQKVEFIILYVALFFGLALIILYRAFS